jgi:hypothetical protein
MNCRQSAPRWRSPRGAGGRTQRIEARLLFITQRIVEFRERGLHGLHCAKRGVEPLLHRLGTTRGGQHLVGRATDLEVFRRLDGGILQVVERGPLRRRGLDRLADAVDRQVGDAGRLLVAKLREIALVLAGGVGIIRRRRCWTSRPDLGERWASRLVATTEEDRLSLSFRRNSIHDDFGSD